MVERSKEEIAKTIRKRLESVEGVKGVPQLDVRVSGKRLDINVFLSVKTHLKWEDSHKIALTAEREVKIEYPQARVVINTEPLAGAAESVWKLVKDTAEGVPGSRGVHNIHIQKIDKKLYIDLHLEVSANMTVKQAHEVADQVEKKIMAADSDISEVTIHIESAAERVSRELAGVETELESYVAHIAKDFPEIKDVCNIEIRRVGDALHMVLRCHFDANLSIQKAHEISSQLEKEIRSAYPKITRIDVHEEPL
jgi:divalent metal cation (Fe/Co/Zn/Cd) transporter